jgi:hypothetical protein
MSRSISTLGSITVGDTFLYCTSSLDCRPSTAFLLSRVLKKISSSAFEHAHRFETGHKHNFSDPNTFERSANATACTFFANEKVTSPAYTR